MAKKIYFQLPVVSAGAEFLVMGNLMRRNILTYKAPQNYEGYDLICIHPDPRYQRKEGEVDKVLVQVKSRYATDSNRGCPCQARYPGPVRFPDRRLPEHRQVLRQE
jgi:hypothetical protein